MAFKIVNGKLVKITSQSDFGTPAQKAAGRKITGTLGNITRSPAPPTRTSTPQKITFGSGDSGGSGSKSGPGVASPVVPLISAGSNTQQTITANTISGFQLANQQPAAAPLQESAIFQSPANEGPQAAPSLDFDPRLLQAGRGTNRAPEPIVPTGTLGLGKPRRVSDVRDFAVPSMAGEIVSGAQLREQNRLKTLNNPRTVGEFEAIGGLPSIQNAINAFMNGEEVNIAFIRFALNQGLLTEDDLFGLDLDASGAGTGSGGGGTSLGPRTQTQFPGGRVPGASFFSMGLTNWRI